MARVANQQNSNVGILVGGGPAPGINGVISAVTFEARTRARKVIGIYDGFQWLMRGDTTHKRARPQRRIAGPFSWRIDAQHLAR